ncbi:hypothetical protein Rhal01_03523 [Rubritalea halochordaticola]|uniref:Uncharacterized protein n=1 Tax=Rubritalea halochordaticola TaxID=714537 RepID=A0ABP9V5R5_9BACT
MKINAKYYLGILFALSAFGLNSCGDDKKVVPNVAVPEWYKEESEDLTDAEPDSTEEIQKPINIELKVLFSHNRVTPPHKKFSNLNASSIQDWAVYTGSPSYDKVVRKDFGKLLKTPLKIGSFEESKDFPGEKHAFTSSEQEAPIVPALYADLKGGLQQGEGYTVGVKVPHTSSGQFSITTYFAAFRVDAQVRIRKSDGTILQEYAFPWEHRAYHALEATITDAAPDSLLYVDVLLGNTENIQGYLPEVGIGLNGIKVERL